MGPNSESRPAWPAADDLPDALRDCAPWWLASLDRALRGRDYDSAAEADRELARLGWHVSPRPTPELRPEREEAANAPPR